MTDEELIAGLNAHPRLSETRIEHHWSFDADVPRICARVAKGEGPKWKSDVLTWMPLDDELREAGPDIISQIMLSMVDVGVEEEVIPDLFIFSE